MSDETNNPLEQAGGLTPEDTPARGDARTEAEAVEQDLAQPVQGAKPASDADSQELPDAAPGPEPALIIPEWDPESDWLPPDRDELAVQQAAPEPPGRPRRWRIPVGIAAGVVLALCVWLFGLGGYRTVLKAVSPQRYLEGALAKSSLQMAESFGVLPDFGRFSGLPNAVDLTVRTDQETSNMLGARVTVQYGLKQDVENNRMLFELSGGAGPISIRDNKLYISPELLALSVPAFFSRAEYITVRPEDFAEEWNDSFLGKDYPLPQELEDWNQADRQQRMGEMQERLMARFKELLAQEGDLYIFADEGYITQDVGDVSARLSVMSYTLHHQEANRFYGEFIQLYKELVQEMFEGYAPLYSGTDYRKTLDEMFQVYEGLSLTEDVVVRFYVDKEQVLRRAELHCPGVRLVDSYGDETTMSFEGDVDLNGVGNPYDTVKCSLTIAETLSPDEERGGQIRMFFTRGREISGTASDDRMSVTFSDMDEAMGRMDLRVEHDPQVTGQDNLRVVATLFEADTKPYGSAVLTGQISESEDQTHLQNGLIEFRDELDEHVGGVEVDIRAYRLEEGALDLDFSDSVNLQDIRSEDFTLFGGR